MTARIAVTAVTAVLVLGVVLGACTRSHSDAGLVFPPEPAASVPLSASDVPRSSAASISPAAVSSVLASGLASGAAAAGPCPTGLVYFAQLSGSTDPPAGGAWRSARFRGALVNGTNHQVSVGGAPHAYVVGSNGRIYDRLSGTYGTGGTTVVLRPGATAQFSATDGWMDSSGSAVMWRYDMGPVLASWTGTPVPVGCPKQPTLSY
jgi:hypothetical protein